MLSTIFVGVVYNHCWPMLVYEHLYINMFMYICWYVVPSMCVAGTYMCKFYMHICLLMYVEKLMVCMSVSILFVYIMDNIIVL